MQLLNAQAEQSMRKLTQQEFELKVYNKYPELKVVSEYINSRSPIVLTCTNKDKLNNAHGKYMLSDSSSLLTSKNNKNGCKKCANESRARAKTKHSHNETFFEIPNLINSYWAGFIAADGCIQHNNKVIIKLSKKDVNHLKKFKTDINFNGVLYECTRKTNYGGSPDKQKYNGKEYSTSTIYLSNAQKLVHDLSTRFNIHHRKSLTLSYPNNLSPVNELAFIKGYIDGDGYIEFGARTRIIICGTKHTLLWIKLIFDGLVKSTSSNGLVAGVRKHSQSDNLYVYEVGHLRAHKILVLLHSIRTPHLDRKWNNIQNQSTPP